jgi:hypothetical protein
MLAAEPFRVDFVLADFATPVLVFEVLQTLCADETLL